MSSILQEVSGILQEVLSFIYSYTPTNSKLISLYAELAGHQEHVAGENEKELSDGAEINIKQQLQVTILAASQGRSQARNPTFTSIQ